jgi:hypothetical protein
MGFETLRVEDVVQTAGTAAPLPPARYTLKLLGVAPDKYVDSKLAFDLVVADGKYARRRIFPTLPSPTSNEDWPAQVVAKLIGILGIEQQPGETIMETLNRAAGNGHSTFTAETKLYTKSNGEEKPDIVWFSIQPGRQQLS